MKAPFSPYLQEIKPVLKELTGILGAHYEYVSVLASDSVGLSLHISQHNKSVSNQNLSTERGNVVRVMKDGQYSEYAFDRIPAGGAAELARTIQQELAAQLAILAASGSEPYVTAAQADEPLTLFVEKETAELPEQADLAGLVASFTAISDRVMKETPEAIDCVVSGESTHVCKLFLSKNRDLVQSYVHTEGSVAVIASRDGETRYTNKGVSGCCGPEIYAGLTELAPQVAARAVALLDAQPPEPGEYDIICGPDIAGLIAHEAFGHGVEMDMFVKNRTIAKEKIGTRVGSDLVTMHEGALCTDDVTAFVFDDEGTLAGDVTEIDRGILKTGICDALAAARLGTQATGNGRRENFAHKAYTRMTSTVFDSGEDDLEAMIRSIKHGYLLEGVEGGMEDPKHWGIQCAINCGREIVNGEFTGKLAAPIVMTGYVPDLLGSISMASGDRGIEGNGACGKGYKEWVRVADGGPYLKARARLG